MTHAMRVVTVGAALAACLTATPVVRAQQPPWTVNLTPTLNPLPIGLCGAIALRVFDEGTRDVPRNPLGARITMADFDITVSTPDGRSAAAQQIDATHVVACACQGGSVGATGTVTATYPAQSLAANARIPRVSFQTSAPFTIAAAKGPVNPASCVAAAARAAGAGAFAGTALPRSEPPLVRGGNVAAPVPVAPALPVGTAIGAPVLAPVAVTPAVVAPTPVAVVPPSVTIAPSFNARGSFATASEVTVTFALDANGAFATPAEVTVTFAITATGNWVGAPAANFPAP